MFQSAIDLASFRDFSEDLSHSPIYFPIKRNILALFIQAHATQMLTFARVVIMKLDVVVYLCNTSNGAGTLESVLFLFGR